MKQPEHMRKQRARICGPKKKVDQEGNKVALIVVSDTSVDPWTMMIHLENAATAHDAVVATVRARDVTSAAVASPFPSLLDFLHELGWNTSWVHTCRHDVVKNDSE